MNATDESARIPGARPPAPTAVAPPRHGPPALSQAAGRTLQTLRTRLPLLRYRIERLGLAGLGGLAALIATFGIGLFVLLPAHRSIVALSDQLARGEPASRVQPAGGEPALLASLPTRAQIPAVLGQILVAAGAAGVSLDQGRYAYDPPHSGRLGRYSLEFPVKAPYPNVRDFIDRTLRSVPAAGLAKLRIKRKDVGSTRTQADIGFVVYLRGN